MFVCVLQVPYSISEMMEEWTLQLGYPIVTMHVHYGDTQIRMVLSQERFLTNLRLREEKSKENIWWHVKLTFSMNEDRNSEHETWLLNEPKEFVIRNANQGADWDFVLANVRCEHFYRVNYDQDTWARIVGAVREDSHYLNSATKSCLIDNAWELLAANLLSADVALNLTFFSLRNDTSYPLWKTINHHLKNVYSLMYRSGHHTQFYKYCESIIDLALQANNDTKQRDDFASIRNFHIEDFANFVGHPSFVQNSVNLALEWVELLG